MPFFADDKGKLQEMFQAMSRCQALHPDPEDEENVAEENEGDEEEDEEGMYGKLCFRNDFLRQKMHSVW